MANVFQDRSEAGQVLAGRLAYLANRNDVLVLALSRGGVPVAAEVSGELHAPLDIYFVRPLNLAKQDDSAIGAVAPGNLVIASQKRLESLNVSEQTLNELASEESRELERREKACRESRSPIEASGKIVILVDDGRAMSVTLRAAILALRQSEPAGIILGLPVAPPELCAELGGVVDQMICLESQEPEYAAGLYYRHYPEVTNEEVGDMLRQSAEDLRQAR